MRGILAASGYIPYRRLQRSAIRDVMGSGGGKGTRSVASFDEDTTTMAVEACRLLGREPSPQMLMFATATPSYLDKTNAAAIHAALRLDDAVAAFDAGGAIRSGVGALRAALDSGGSVLVAASDMRTGLPTSADESAGGDGAAAMLVGDGEVAAEYLSGASLTREFLERWRSPGDVRSKAWEDRFGESMYVPLGEQTYEAALKNAGMTADQVDVVCVAGMHARSVGRLAKKFGNADDDLSGSVGNTGTAQPLLLLVNALENLSAGQVVALVSLADGADALIFRRTDREIGTRRSVADQIAAASDIPYTRFLTWRGMVTPEPPNRPEPARVSAPAAERAEEWKFGLVQDTDQVSAHSLADTQGSIVTFTVDRLAYSPSPPIVFAIVDFEGGGRLPIEMTDVDPDSLAVGDRVEMTFRRLTTADGIHNYFWKARPVR